MPIPIGGRPRSFDNAVEYVMRKKGISRERASAYVATVERKMTASNLPEENIGIVDRKKKPKTDIHLLLNTPIGGDTLAAKLEELKRIAKGGLAAGRPDSDFDQRQLEMGTKVEMEHTDDPKKARQIAKDHLVEDPKYYTKLKKMESAKMKIASMSEAIPRLAKRPRMARYIYTGHEKNEMCATFHGKTFDLNDLRNRPVPPSEGLGFTTQHPHCKCYWERIEDDAETDDLSKRQKKHIHRINRLIGQRSRHGMLHLLNKKGGISRKTTFINPRQYFT